MEDCDLTLEIAEDTIEITLEETGPRGMAGGIQSVVGGDNVTIDNTDPENPVINATPGGGGGGAVDSVNGEVGVVQLSQDDIPDGTTAKQYTATEKAKLEGIESGAQVNNLSDVNATDLTDGGVTSLHSHIVTKANVGLGSVDNTSDANKPVSTAQQAALNLKQSLAEKDAVGGYAGLDGDGKINPSQLPALAITETFPVGSQAAMLALTAQQGDVAVRTDQNKSYILRAVPASSLGNWQELLTPTDAVNSIFGRSGNVTAQNGDYNASQIANTPAGNIGATTVGAAINELDTEKVAKTTTVNGHDLSGDVTVTKADVGLGNVTNTSDANKPVSTAQQTALDLKVDKTTTVNAKPLSGNITLDKTDIGLGNVDNTSNATERAAAATLTNKRITARTQTLADAATVTPDTDLYDKGRVLELSQATTIANPTGTPTSMQAYILRVKSTVARALTFGSAYRAIGVTLPTTTVAGKILYMGLMWNTTDSKWDVVAVAQEA